MNETTQASYNPYESYLLMSPPLPPPPPPPPPDSMPRRSHKLWKIALPIFCLLLLIIGIFFYPFLTSLLHAKNAATGGKVAHSYTATDILHAFLAAGIPTSYIQYNDDIWSFIGDDHPPIDIEPSVSSVWFYEDVPGAIGVWVYATSAQAKQTGAEVAAYEKNPAHWQQDSGQEPVYVHGRCLLLGAGEGRERQVVREQCS